MTPFNQPRLRLANERPENPDGDYVLYWAQMSRRLTASHALDHALDLAKKLNKPLVVYEGLKLNYPWANARIHTFMLEGMRDNAARAAELGLNYWPFVETPENPGRGLVRRLCERAGVLVTDDYPQFITPAHNRAVARKVRVAVHAVDGNGLIPLAKLGAPVAAANHLRPRVHKQFAEAWANRAAAEPDLAAVSNAKVTPPFELWRVPGDLGAFVKSLPLDQTVPPVAGSVGGATAGREHLATFIQDKLPRYSSDRGKPDDPAQNAASRLSPYLHYGYLGIQEVAEAVLGTVKEWTPAKLNPKTRNKDDFYCRNPDVNDYLDEAVTWRDVGYHWHYTRLLALEATHPEPAKSWQDAGEAMPSFNYQTFDFSPLAPAGTLEQTLPPWATATLEKHANDERPHLYGVAELEAAATHDDLWNAAHREMAATGRIHNYLRMLWGKKVLQWSRTPEEAYRALEYLNNRYALDGRDPNSYTGILWIFGLFDRPWPPERPIFGGVRYMTSDSTAKKFKLQGYLDYVNRLPTVAALRGGH